MSFIGKAFVNICWKIKKQSLGQVGNGSSVGTVPEIIGPSNVFVGNNVKFGKNVTIHAWNEYENIKYRPHIEIGDDVTITDRVYISCIDTIKIGDNVLIGRDVYISDNSHGARDYSDIGIPPAKRKLSSKGPVNIGNGVWIGKGTCILSGVLIGENSIIGANSIVNKDVPPHCIVAGNPAKIIRMLA